MRIGARKQALLALHDLAQLVFLILREVRLVGDPHRPVLHSMHGLFVWHRLLVEARVLPDRVMISTDRGALLVGNWVFSVVTTQVLEALHACWLRSLLTSIGQEDHG